jgi:hypothetical protein
MNTALRLVEEKETTPRRGGEEIKEEEGGAMDEVEVFPALRLAHMILEDWNAHHPEEWTPWEWLEEAVLARRRWKRAGRRSPALAARNYQRYQEFVAKIPSGLLNKVISDG